MNRPIDPLDRLFQAARQAPRPALVELPAALEAHLLATWKFARAENDFPRLLPLFRLALGCACVVMLCAVFLNLREWKRMTYNEVTTPTVVVNWAWMR
jgi:hypothetical protein